MSDPDTRKILVARLPIQFRARLQEATTLLVTVSNLVSVACDYPDGLRELLSAVRYFEGDSLFMRRFAQCVAETSLSRVPYTIFPSYPDEITRRLSEQLEAAYQRKRELEEIGATDLTAVVVQEILHLKRQLREGGQLKAGDILGDQRRFVLLRPIGRGGFGTVWEAYDRDMDKRAAVKVLHSSLSGAPVPRERFFRGARTMVELDHESIVKIVIPQGEDQGYYYFVMEHISGGNLEDAILSGQIVNDQMLPIILRVGEALSELHSQGLVHRDIKPQNILLTANGEPKLTDFDLVAAPDTTGGTATHGAMGTMVYAAPEAMEAAADATSAADVYGLAMMAVFMFHGQRLPLSIIRDESSFVSHLGCGRAIKKVLKKALDWSPDRRYSDAAAFCTALRSPTILVGKLSATDVWLNDDRLEIVQGDITRMPTDAIVNPSNENLDDWSGGVSKAILTTAGNDLKTECMLLTLELGGVGITGGHGLPARHVIHTAVPPWAGELATCYQNCIDLLVTHRLSSIAFPILGTGRRGMPVEDGIAIAIDTLRFALRSHETVERVVLCCFTGEHLQTAETILGIPPRSFIVVFRHRTLRFTLRIHQPVKWLLDYLWVTLLEPNGIPALTYGKYWRLQNSNHGGVFPTRHGEYDAGKRIVDRRSLIEAGIEPGSEWTIVLREHFL